MKNTLRLRDRTELLARIRSVSPQSSRRWGRMSSHQMDQERSGTPPEQFAADVRALETMLERFAAGSDPIAHEHPFFGPLTRWQWGRFHYRHIDHHLRQFGS